MRRSTPASGAARRPESDFGSEPRNHGDSGTWSWILLAVSVIAATGAAVAQPYPNKPIRMIIPAAPGGGVDTLARLIGQPLSDTFGQPVVMDNRAGAGTMIGSELTAKSPPDGYTVLMVTNSHAINASLYKNLRYDPAKDFAEVTLAATAPYLLIIHPSVPAKSVKELIALAKRRPGELYFASAGSGSSTHLAGELFVAMARISMVHVPYKGGGPAVIDLLGGHVQMMFSDTIHSLQFIKSNRLRGLAITSPKRSALLPDLPTVSESGVPGYESGAWYGMLVPARTAPEIIRRLNGEVVRILKTRDARERIAAEGAEAVGSTPEEFTAVMKKEIEKWARLIPTLKLQLH